MTRIHPAWVEYQRRRFEKPKVARYLIQGSELDAAPSIDQSQDFKFNPDQPRVPAGNSDGGRWMATGINDPRILSDAAPDSVQAGTQYAQIRTRGPTFTIINGRPVQVSPGQEAALAAAQNRAEGAIARVRELDRDWSPKRSAYDTVEGQIEHYRSQAEQAQARASELGRAGIGPGPFACESIPARGTGQVFGVVERELINRIGNENGCHTCGTRDPGTKSGNFVPDHQYPTALNSLGRAQRLYPQCLSCSTRQGGVINGLK